MHTYNNIERTYRNKRFIQKQYYFSYGVGRRSLSAYKVSRIRIEEKMYANESRSRSFG